MTASRPEMNRSNSQAISVGRFHGAQRQTLRVQPPVETRPPRQVQTPASTTSFPTARSCAIEDETSPAQQDRTRRCCRRAGADHSRRRFGRRVLCEVGQPRHEPDAARANAAAGFTSISTHPWPRTNLLSSDNQATLNPSGVRQPDRYRQLPRRAPTPATCCLSWRGRNGTNTPVCFVTVLASPTDGPDQQLSRAPESDAPKPQLHQGLC